MKNFKEVKKKDGTIVVFCKFDELLKEAYEASNMDEVETHKTSTGEYIIHCPFCKEEGHTKHKLYIKSDLTVGHCFVCHRAYINVNDDIRLDYKVPNFCPNLIVPNELIKLSDPTWSLDKYYNEFEDFDKHGYEYLINRNPYLKNLYKILGFKFWKGNVVMPFFDNNNEVFYYQIRFTTGNSNIRYFFPPISYKPCYIIRHGNNKKLAICEGVFDAIALLIMAPEYTPIAVMGSSISDYQLNIIRKFTPDKIIIAMDETKLSIGILNKIKKVIDYCPISIIKSDGEDPEEKLRKRISNNEKINWIK